MKIYRTKFHHNWILDEDFNILGWKRSGKIEKYSKQRSRPPTF